MYIYFFYVKPCISSSTISYVASSSKERFLKNTFRYWQLFEKFQLKNHFFNLKRFNYVEKKLITLFVRP